MSYIMYISFPKELVAFRLSDIKGREKEFGINYVTNNLRQDIYLFPNISPWESNIVIIDKKNAIFNNCFKNPFIYNLNVALPNEYYSKKVAITQEMLDDETKKRKYTASAEKCWLILNELLYNFIEKNLIIGEFAEIYISWHDHVCFDFGQPTSERTLNLRDLIIPMPIMSLSAKKSEKLTVLKVDD